MIPESRARRKKAAFRAAGIAALLLLPRLIPAQRAQALRITPANPPVDVLAGGGWAWRVRPSLPSGGTDRDAGALVGLLRNASGNPADVLAGEDAETGIASLFRLSVEWAGGSAVAGPIPYAPQGATEYDPIRREVALPEQIMGGLRTRRIVRVSANGTSAVWLDQITNVSGVPLTVWAELSADAAPEVGSPWTMTSSGDARPDPGDVWVAAGPVSGGPAIAVLLGGSGSRAVLAEVRTEAGATGASGGGSTSFRYQLRLDPGESGVLLSGAFLGATVSEAAASAEAASEAGLLKRLIAAREARDVFNLDPLRLTCCGCDFAVPTFRQPDRNAVVDGAFPCRVRAYAGSPPLVELEIYGRYKGVSASGLTVVWQGPLLDEHVFVPADNFLDEDRDLVAERLATLNTADFAGGIDASRRLDAVLWSNCGDYFGSNVGSSGNDLPIVDGNPCQTHIDIISPLSGTILDRPVNVAVQPYCPGSAQVEILADGTSIYKGTAQKETGRLAPARIYLALDPASIKAGTKKITARITGSDGCGETEEIEVVIPNQPPTLIVNSPSEGAIVTGSIPIRFQVTDDRRLDRLEIYADGLLSASLALSGTSASGSLDWDSFGLANGVHALRIRAVDWDEASASVALRVDVRNVFIDLTAARREAQQKSLVDLRFRYQNPTSSPVGSFAVWRKADGGEYARIGLIPAAAAADGNGVWVDLPGKAGSFTYKIEALDAGGRVIGRSREARL